MKDKKMMKWVAKREIEIIEQIDNTRTWIYPSFDDWMARADDYFSERLVRKVNDLYSAW
jgi:hypothetical protein